MTSFAPKRLKVPGFSDNVFLLTKKTLKNLEMF